MAHSNLFLGIVNLSTGLLAILISIPLVLGKISMNPIYGFRFAKSFESDEAWDKVNAYGGRQLIIWSVPLLLSGLACFFVDFQHRPLLGTLTAVMPLIIVVPVVLSWHYTRKL